MLPQSKGECSICKDDLASHTTIYDKVIHNSAVCHAQVVLDITQCHILQVRVPDAEDPDDAAAAEQKRKGDVAFVGKRYQEALQAYSQSLRHNTSNHVVWANRSAVYLRLNDPQAALDDARRARTLDESYTKVIVIKEEHVAVRLSIQSKAGCIWLCQ